MDLLGDNAVLQNNALEGKTALICGASRGIGAATAKIMAKAGANVILASRSEDQLIALLNELSALGEGHHQILVMDLEDTDNIATCIQPILDNKPIHILVNNAGGPPVAVVECKRRGTRSTVYAPSPRRSYLGEIAHSRNGHGQLRSNHPNRFDECAGTYSKPRRIQHASWSNGLMGEVPLARTPSFHHHQQCLAWLHRY